MGKKVMKRTFLKRVVTLCLLLILVFSCIGCEQMPESSSYDLSKLYDPPIENESDKNKESIDYPYDWRSIGLNEGEFVEFRNIADLKEYLATTYPNLTFLLVDTEEICIRDIPYSFRLFYRVYLNDNGIPYVITNATVKDKSVPNKKVNCQRKGLINGPSFTFTYNMIAYPVEKIGEITYKQYLLEPVNTSLDYVCYFMQGETAIAICIYGYGSRVEKIPEDSYIENIFDTYTYFYTPNEVPEVM